MRVLVACEFSGVVREAFRKRGHDAWSCDLEPAADASPYHFQGDVLNLLANSYIAEGNKPAWDLMIAHPPCTYMTRSGWHWVNKPDSCVHPLKGQPRRIAAIHAAEFFMLLMGAAVPRIAIENPRPIRHVNLPAANQTIQPWKFGHGETKATCLWLKNLPKLEATNVVDGREGRCWKESPGIKNGLTRQQRRSITYKGIADAMADQWGCL